MGAGPERHAVLINSGVDITGFGAGGGRTFADDVAAQRPCDFREGLTHINSRAWSRVLAEEVCCCRSWGWRARSCRTIPLR
ncbi:hypothetical protein ACFB49_22120 [Sphingomonas sp. DBB INV C78]